MISPESQRSQATADEIEELIVTFFESADRDKDDVISQEEFVQGVQDMPIILQLLQADPGKDSKFDQLADETETRKDKQINAETELSATGKKYAC